MMRRAIVSYFEADHAIALRLARDLDRAGLGVWFDKWDIRVGDSIIEKVSNALETNDGLIVVLSPVALSSEILRRQMTAATMMELQDRRITVLPVIAEACVLPGLLRDKQPAYLVPDYRAGLTQLLRAIAPELVEQRLRREGSGVVGIDFGTGTSLVGTIEDGRPVIIPNRLGNRITPSVITRTTDGEWIVGEHAVAQAEANPRGTFFSIKRRLGTNFTAEVDGERWPAWRLAAVILRQLRDDAEAYLGRSLAGAVLGCPAYFNAAERRDLLQAATEAGIPVIRLLAEPSAAVLANGIHLRERGNIAHNVLVYDLGAGSFDVSVADVGDGIVEVLAISGDTRLGGDDFDAAIAEECRRRFRDRHGIDPNDDDRARRRLLQAAELAKVTLSSASTAVVFVPSIAVKPGSTEWLDLTERFTLAQFEALTRPFVERTIASSRKAVQQAARWGDRFKIDTALLSGQPTRTPLVRQALRDAFGLVPTTRIDPEEAVALGTALQASIATGGSKDELLLDVIPFSLGVAGPNDMFVTILRSNMTLPTYGWEAFEVECNAGEVVDVGVYEGEHEQCSQNRLVGCATFRVPGHAENRFRFTVELTVDTNGKKRFIIEGPDLRSEGPCDGSEVPPSNGCPRDLRPLALLDEDSALSLRQRTRGTGLWDKYSRASARPRNEQTHG